MLEIAARALFETWAESEGTAMSWEDAQKAALDPDAYPNMAKIVPLAYAEARAVLKAIRVPDEGMLDVGACYEPEGIGRDEGAIADDIWQAMIDSILNESEAGK